MYKRLSAGWLKHLDFMVLDILTLQLAFLAGYGTRIGFSNPYAVPLYRNMAIVLTLIQIMVMFFDDSFKNVMKRGYYKELVMTVKNTLYVILIGVFYLFLVQAGNQFSRSVLILAALYYVVLSYAVRILWKGFLKRKGAKDRGSRSMIILTTEENASGVVSSLQKYSYSGVRIAGLVLLDAAKSERKICGIPVVADKETVLEYVCREWVDEILVALPDGEELPQKMIHAFLEMGVTLHQKLFTNQKNEGQKQMVERIGDFTVLTTSINMATSGQLFLKRAMDIAGGLVGCLLTAILFVFLAPAIYMQSPGPIFFSQVRVGKNGKKFKIYKFRSMYMDAEERKKELMKDNRVSDGMMFKLDNDPRIIGSEKGPGKGIGNFIRKYSLDEFAQFWNVLKGDMSLVGTRPPTVDEWEKYELHHRARLAIKPGLTGMWQVSGRSEITDFEEVVRLDTQYITEWSFLLDIKILLKTVLVVFGKKGSM